MTPSTTSASSRNVVQRTILSTADVRKEKALIKLEWNRPGQSKEEKALVKADKFVFQAL